MLQKIMNIKNIVADLFGVNRFFSIIAIPFSQNLNFYL